MFFVTIGCTYASHEHQILLWQVGTKIKCCEAAKGNEKHEEFWVMRLPEVILKQWHSSNCILFSETENRQNIYIHKLGKKLISKESEELSSATAHIKFLKSHA